MSKLATGRLKYKPRKLSPLKITRGSLTMISSISEYFQIRELLPKFLYNLEWQRRTSREDVYQLSNFSIPLEIKEILMMSFWTISQIILNNLSNFMIKLIKFVKRKYCGPYKQQEIEIWCKKTYKKHRNKLIYRRSYHYKLLRKVKNTRMQQRRENNCKESK